MRERNHNGTSPAAVVIGSGLGGLSCAAFMARSGYNVTVLEQHDKLGGYATSFKQGDFDFEVSLHATTLGRNPMTRMLRHLGVTDRVEFVKLPELHRVISPHHDLTFPNGDAEGYVRTLAREFPGEKEGIRSFVERITAVARDAERLHSRDERFFLPLFPFQYRSMWKTRGLSLAQMLSQHVEDPELQALMSVLWYYYGLPPSRLSAFYFAVATGDYLINGGSYPRGRSQDLSNALVEIIRENGGRVLLNTRARSISFRRHRAYGVDDERGRRHEADLVVSNASPRVTFNGMLETNGAPRRLHRKLERYRRKLEGYRPSLSSFVVWLGLDRDVTDRLEEAEIFLMPESDGEAQYRACLAGDARNAMIAITIYDNVFAGYSPPGKSTMMIMFLTSDEPWRRFEEGYFGGDKDAYRREKQRVADILVDRVEEALLPGLWDMVEEYDAATPLTNIRFTGNCQGAIYGFEQALNNTFVNRIDNRTPVRNIYLASAWSSPGGGFAGALRAGQKAFRAIERDFGR